MSRRTETTAGGEKRSAEGRKEREEEESSPHLNFRVASRTLGIEEVMGSWCGHCKQLAVLGRESQASWDGLEDLAISQKAKDEKKPLKPLDGRSSPA